MPNSYLSDGIFNLHRRTSMDSFSCILFLLQLHVDLNMCCYKFYAKITTFFDQEKFGTAVLYVDVETFGGNWCENDVKTSKSSYWHHAQELSYTPHVGRHFLAPVGFMEIWVGYARKNSVASAVTSKDGLGWGNINTISLVMEHQHSTLCAVTSALCPWCCNFSTMCLVL